jgi:hypothetical protein
MLCSYLYTVYQLSMTEAKIMTKHPLGKTGRSVSKASYDIMKQAIVKALQKKELTHTELVNEVTKTLRGKVDYNINWYAVTVKLDLEARKIIMRTTARPQTYRVK